MTHLVGIIIIIIWSLLELCNVNILVKHFLNIAPKKFRIWDFAAKLLVYLLILVGYMYVVVEDSSSMVAAMFFTVLVFFKSGVLLSSFYDLKPKNLTIIAFFVELTSFIGYNISLIFDRVWTIPYEYSHLTEIIGAVFFLIVSLILLMLRKRNIFKIWIADLSSIDHIHLIIILFTIGILEALIFRSDEFETFIRIIMGIVVVSTVLLIIKVIVITEKKNFLEDINFLLEDQMKQTTDYYNELIEKDNQTKKFRHDIKNLLIVLHVMINEGKNEKASSYIEEMQEICAQLRPKYDTGNFMADAILSAKDTKAAQYNTNIVFEGFIPAEKVKDVDMVVVLSNVLDNAIEACEKIDGEKTIHINSILKKKMWVLCTDNPSGDVCIINSNKIATTKEEKTIHGFGLQNIEKVAEKYNGNMQINFDNGRFSSKITFVFD
ncbi:GHKL domain-containing protein [Pseudobutyrivibrio sp. 49]|uniref:sensor histidine kinase n=1 Tax=unclassified Pseudobutyrivibrio TaxID=2638619 RepID=UPI00088E79E1|nr:MULTISPECIES: GHKL domain-containing protein [unclassified Pseudobutyrivibrio]SDI40230.1 GHKL domain-containing protein [Pseudobutyrivibrio sp. 49]SFO05899.1 GHKL domain-containing protein [Pseudobutyrivibrio sp. UC1225]